MTCDGEQPTFCGVPATRFRLVVVGLNHYHVTGWVESLGWLRDRIDVVAVYDPDMSRSDGRPPDHADPSLRQSFPDWLMKLPFESNLDELISTHQPDIALVTLPNNLASGAIKRFAESGIHVLADKPGARTAPEAAMAFGAARNSATKLSIALTRRHHPGWQAAAQFIASGKLGRLLTTEAVLVTSSVTVRDPSNVIFGKESMGGGVLHWLGVHEIDALMWLTGEEITAVQAMSANIGDPHLEVENVLSGSVQYESGAVGTIHFTYALPGKMSEGYVAIRGTKGSVKVLPDGAWTSIGPDDADEPFYQEDRTYASGPSTGYGVLGVPIINDLLSAIELDREPAASGSDVLKVLQVIDALYTSTESGKRELVMPLSEA